MCYLFKMHFFFGRWVLNKELYIVACYPLGLGLKAIDAC